MLLNRCDVGARQIALLPPEKFQFRAGAKIFPFSIVARLLAGPKRSPIQCAPKVVTKSEEDSA
jgi:hypothetical protein